MSHRPFAPDAFAVGLLVFEVFLMLFPAMRVVGIVAIFSGVAYWLLMAALKSMRR